MSKKEVAPVSKPQKAYVVERRDGGYALICLSIQDSKVVSSLKISEPDMFAITLSKLSRELVKDQNG